MWRLLKVSLLVQLLAGCVIPPFDATGKTCTTDTDCGTLPCVSSEDGNRRCRASIDVTDAGGSDGGWWVPARGLSWQIQTNPPIDVDVDAAVFAVPLNTPSETIAQLRMKGRRVICRIDTGVGLNRDPTVMALPSSVVGNALDSNSKWLDIRSAPVRARAIALTTTAQQLGCHGVAYTYIDGFLGNTGLSLTAQNSIDFLTAMVPEAHQRGLSVGLDNTVDIGPAVAPQVDWATNESCLQFSECQRLDGFAQRNKAVFHWEFGDVSSAASLCSRARPWGFSTIIKNMRVDAWRATCPP